MGIFGKGKHLKSAGYFVTNAPDHWPSVPLVPLSPTSMPLAVLQFRQAYRADAKPPMGKIGLSWMFEEGFILVPFTIHDGSRDVAVFVFAEPSPEWAAHFFGVRAALLSRGEPEPVYFSPKPLPMAAPISPFWPFRPVLLTRVADNEAPKGSYLQWWGTTQQTISGTDPGLLAIGRAYRAMADYESYFLAELMMRLGQKRPEAARVVLPRETYTIPLRGPEEKIFLLMVSQEHGLQWAFHRDSTPGAYRNLFLRHFADWAERSRRDLRAANFPPDEPGDPQPAHWWAAIEATHRNPSSDLFQDGVTTIFISGLDVR